MHFDKIILVGVGGFIGSIGRYVTVLLVDKRLNSVFPYGTMCVNIVGSFILGLVLGYSLKRGESAENWRLLLATGFCGGFTTFSAFAWENVNLLQERLFSTSLLYIVSSVILGLVAVLMGMMLIKSLS